MMSKATLALLISIVGIILVVSVVVFVGCNANAQSTKQTYRSVKAVISYGVDEVYKIDVKSYHRISSGWIGLEASDGRMFYTNEENVLLMFEP